MLERITDLPAGVYGLRATGKVTKDDYDAVVDPLLKEAGRDGRRIRLLYHFTPAFDGFTPAGAWEDAKIGLQYLRLFERCAVVSDKDWIRGTARAFATMLPCPVKVYGEAELSAAVAWLGAPAGTPRVSHRMIPEHAVLLVELQGKLGAEDFDAITATLDAWLESGRALRGFVVHAREFPGWENLGGFFRHLRFVRDHHRKIRRVALAVDGKVAKLAPALVEGLVGAEIQHFGYAEIDRAIEWAGRELAA